jgi:intracellular multiplication protein IcmK
MRFILKPTIFSFFIAMVCFAYSSANAQDSDQAASSGASSSVAQFQQWLREQDDESQQTLEQYADDGLQSGGDSALDQDDISAAAFDQLVQQSMPMSPEQISAFKGHVLESQRALASPPGIPATPVSSTLSVDLSPGATPPAIKMGQGFISSMVFLDSSGSPWPITAYDLGNEQAFNVQWDQESNILMVQPLEAYTVANLAVRLEGLATPIMLTLVPGQASIDYRVDIRIPGLGPNAKSSVSGATMPRNSDPTLLSVLDGIPPSGARELEIDSGIGQAWLANDILYLRSRFTVLSPGWLDQMSSPDGTYAYALPVTPAVLISHYGQPKEIQIKGE